MPMLKWFLKEHGQVQFPSFFPDSLMPMRLQLTSNLWTIHYDGKTIGTYAQPNSQDWVSGLCKGALVLLTVLVVGPFC